MQIDVSIAFYGKPYQTIATIESLLRQSSQHIDTVCITCEKQQPWEDYSGIYKIINVFDSRVINGKKVK